MQKIRYNRHHKGIIKNWIEVTHRDLDTLQMFCKMLDLPFNRGMIIMHRDAIMRKLFDIQMKGKER